MKDRVFMDTKKIMKKIKGAKTPRVSSSFSN